MSDRIAVMNNGRIVQIGTPHQIYHQPNNVFVASFVGRSNLLRGKLLEQNAQDGSTKIATALGPVLCKAPRGAAGVLPGAALIRPEHVVLAAPSGASDLNRFQGRVVHVAFLGESTERVVRIGDVEILVRSMAGQPVGSETVDVFFPPERTLAVANDEN